MDAVANVVVETGKCLWNSLADPISYVSNPTKNLNLLEREVNQLMNKSADIERRVEVEEIAQLSQRTNQVVGWLKEIQGLRRECERVLDEGKLHQQNKCLVWCCPSDCRLNYKLGKKVSQLCKDVRDCLDAGEITIVVTPLPPPPVREMPIEETVGLDSLLSQVWNWLQEEHIGFIGLYGMGGVGKTTLLKKVYEEFHHKSREFHVVLWIVVSKQVNLKEIRESIRKDLGINDDVWSNQSENGARATLCEVLNTKKFVLLIDDIWKRLDVAEIGIPIPNPKNGSKIVFTTRSEQVCNDMKAVKLKVPCMSSEKALQLFCENVGEETLALHREIPNYAIEIANECKGLPLALITIGRAMASMKTPTEWASALRVLRQYPSKFSEMVDDVYNLLQFSYDRLSSTQQQCFLYCALFPEDSNIDKYRLIDLWIAEGFLGETNNIYETRDEGELILRRLKSACLLESGSDEENVKMHDVIRDMALWLAHDQGQNDNKVIVEVYDEKIAKNISRWQEAERISLIVPGEEVILTEPPVCSHLLTLLSHDHNNLEISEQFFMSSPALRVFEFNRSPYSSAYSIGRLEKFSIGISGPINLRYLNLSYTNIEELPVEITKLTSLLYLLLEWTNKLRISKEVISCLSSLKVFRKSHKRTMTTKGFIEGVECLKQLDELALTIHDASDVRKLLGAPNLRRSIRDLRITSCDDLASIDANISRRLELTNLHSVSISKSNPVNLSWLIYAPNLQDLSVLDCSTLEVIFDEDILQTVDEDASARLFSSLRSLQLINLPKLRSIHKGTLSSLALTNLHRVNILDCNPVNLSWLIYAPNLQDLSVLDCSTLEVIFDEDILQTVDKDVSARLFSSLRFLRLSNLPKLWSIHKGTLSSLALTNLHSVDIANCNLVNLSWLIYASNLQDLCVIDCSTLEVIFDEDILQTVDEDASARLFSSLRSLSLSHLPKLSIHKGTLSSVALTNLHSVNISYCNPVNLSWLIYARNLQDLDVRNCSTLEIIFDEDILQTVDEDASARLFSSLRSLILVNLPKLRSIHKGTLSSLALTNLHRVSILSCNPVNLSWLIYAPNLQDLSVWHCSTLEVIFDEDILQTVDEDASARLFSSLRFLELMNLPKLRSIHKGTLSSPVLTTIEITFCPGLKKLPFDFNSAKNSFKEVRAERAWWSALEWDDEAAKAFFTEKALLY